MDRDTQLKEQRRGGPRGLMWEKEPRVKLGGIAET